MSMWSTWDQSFKALRNIEGKSLKEKLLEDGYIREAKREGNDTIAYRFQNIPGAENGEVHFIFGNDNILDYFIAGNKHDPLKANIDIAKEISKIYPHNVFEFHASYCPGGGGVRVTAAHENYKNGGLSDPKGIPCYGSAWVCSDWIKKAEMPGKVNLSFNTEDHRSYCITVSEKNIDFDRWGDGYLYIYTKEESFKALINGEERYMGAKELIRACEAGLDMEKKIELNSTYDLDDDLGI